MRHCGWRRGGAGGDGVLLNSATTVTNNGTIAGGNGGAAGSGVQGGSAGNGGAGINASVSGDTITNMGTIKGGSGGSGCDTPAGTAGAGIEGVSVTINNSGTIEGGDSGAGDALNVSGESTLNIEFRLGAHRRHQRHRQRSILTIDPSLNTTLSNPITGSGGIVETGSETLTLNGDNTYSGGTRSIAAR